VVEPNTGAFRKETSWPPVPPHVALRHSRRYLVELLNTHLPDYPSTAPATPAEPAAPNGAEVLGLVRHLTANSLLAESNLTGRAPTSMAELSPLSLAELLAEWERSGAVVEEALRDARGLTGSLLVTDLFAHELDIRRTLWVDEPRCHPALDTALDVAAGTAGATVAVLGLPTLRLETLGAAWEIGEAEPAATVWGPPLDLYSCLTGKRSVEQIRALKWTEDPEPWLRAFAGGLSCTSQTPQGRTPCGEPVY